MISGAAGGVIEMEVNKSKLQICSLDHLKNLYEKFGLPRLIISLFL